MILATLSARIRRERMVRAVLGHQALECRDADDVIEKVRVLLHFVDTGRDPDSAVVAQYPKPVPNDEAAA